MSNTRRPRVAKPRRSRHEPAYALAAPLPDTLLRLGQDRTLDDAARRLVAAAVLETARARRLPLGLLDLDGLLDLAGRTAAAHAAAGGHAVVTVLPSDALTAEQFLDLERDGLLRDLGHGVRLALLPEAHR